MSAFLTIVVIHLLAVCSPGPDFVFITKQSLTGTRRNAILGSLGLGLGILLHCTYCILGLGLIISQSIIIFTILKYISAIYLVYIGWKSLTHKKAEMQKQSFSQIHNNIPVVKAIGMGFVCNALNPKVTMFFLAVFSQVIEPGTPMHVQAFYGMYMGIATFVWFSALSTILNLEVIRSLFAKMHSGIERVMGAILIGLGIKVAMVSQK